ncbi:MAG: tRNA (adenosine(37)-N6)-threonylcarbamoyltransferase complex transferase subunit TsaD [Flavobacteriales bacterium]|nr:tRNA (adenosine(37)-N6)-threonylcarbamoyltransferase complex transferase subunit TsaD [Flavobacteriales bacterium]|tara:strand:+ start:1616 stop:2635 length:1020 start_codon:yes stop_codon:yes gene_type:complete
MHNLKKQPYILAIESSCDDTSAAILKGNIVLSNVVSTQQVHKEYGGVVPELASRAHQKNIIPTVDSALKRAEISKSDLDAIAFTRGPGLLGSLLVGVSFAKSLSLALNKPMIEVNHMEAHILAHLINDGSPTPEFPFLCLTVSGGHTQLVIVNSPLEMKVIGETIDDAAGEAFDKISKIMELPYPGGPLIDKYAKEGNADAYKFPHPKVGELEFSFSGLKTSVLRFLQKEVRKDEKFIENHLNDICASVQKTIVDILVNKIKIASKKTGITRIAIAGGVSANSELRKRLLENTFKWDVFIPDFQFCTDNAGMIGIAGYYKYQKEIFVDQSVVADARLRI